MGKTACGRFSDISFVAGRKRRGFCGLLSAARHGTGAYNLFVTGR
jgi:hypothetical protein